MRIAPLQELLLGVAHWITRKRQAWSARGDHDIVSSGCINRKLNLLRGGRPIGCLAT
jgi:hypothetical protein